MKYKGYVEYFTYQSPDGSFGIYNLISDDFEDGEMKCLGPVAGIDVGDNLEIEGKEVVHPVYGLQIKVTSCKVLPMEDMLSTERYLASGAIKGIGAALAARIVKKFKQDTFRTMEEEPERLSEIKGISERMAREIAVQMVEKKEIREAMMYLSDFGISNAMALKIYRRYQSELYQVFRSNPYRLAEDIRGIGFRTADEIAFKSGIPKDSPDRIRGGLLYCLSENAQEGNTFMQKERLVKTCSDLLGVETERIEDGLDDLMIDRKIVIKNREEVYQENYYFAELGIATKLKQLKRAFSDRPLNASERERIKERIDDINRDETTVLDEVQTQAVMDCATYGIYIITGGPGTGKTSTIRTIIRYFDSLGQTVLLCAPTGRAAKRMEEATGYAARTIHRLLEVSGSAEDEEQAFFQRNETNPLEADVIVVDEMSMVDTFLFHSLLSAIPPGCRLILSGDSAQLPSVGPGNVLKDLLSIQSIHHTTLERIYRQAEGGDIAGNADRIRKGELPDINGTGGDFYFVERFDSEAVFRDLVLLIRDKIPAKFGVDPLQVQVLAPMKSGNAGVNSLNEKLQERLNPPAKNKPELSRGDTVFRLGDKVMQIKNNYTTKWKVVGINNITGEEGEGVFNGDTGIVTAVNTFEKTLTVTFDDDKEVEYDRDMLEELELAYAVTIHKSQGSEYPAVLIPILDVARVMLYRNLLYTAVSRGTKCVMILGRWETVRRMVETTGERHRDTGLADRLAEVINERYEQ